VLTLVVNARDQANMVIATGSASLPAIVVGERNDITVTLGTIMPPPPDGGDVDGGADAGEPADASADGGGVDGGVDGADDGPDDSVDLAEDSGGGSDAEGDVDGEGAEAGDDV
jgi:hypothetical protein